MSNVRTQARLLGISRDCTSKTSPVTVTRPRSICTSFMGVAFPFTGLPIIICPDGFAPLFLAFSPPLCCTARAVGNLADTDTRLSPNSFAIPFSIVVISAGAAGAAITMESFIVLSCLFMVALVTFEFSRSTSSAPPSRQQENMSKNGTEFMPTTSYFLP